MIGERLSVHLYDDRPILHHAQQPLLTMSRLYATAQSGRLRFIDHRHVFGCLVRKPWTLTGLTFRDELLLSATCTPGRGHRHLLAGCVAAEEEPDAGRALGPLCGLAEAHDRVPPSDPA